MAISQEFKNIRNLYNACFDGVSWNNGSPTLGKRNPDIEAIIINEKYRNFMFARVYCENVIGGRWPEFEAHILSLKNNWMILYKYTVDIIKSRWDVAEAVIVKHPECASYYMRDMGMTGRWLECEKYMERNYSEWIAYAKSRLGYTQDPTMCGRLLDQSGKVVWDGTK
jgi:hypothetical protein